MSIPVELTNRRMETERYSSVKAGRRRLPSELIREVVKFVDTEKWPKKMCRISAVLDSYVRERYWKKVLNTITVETNAQEKLVEAEKTGNTPTEAINLYVQAAEAFKLADNWFKAGETFVKIAKLFELQGNERGYIDNTAEAAECFLKVKKETNSITETDEPGNSGIAQQQIRNSKKTDEQGNSGIVQHGNSKSQQPPRKGRVFECGCGKLFFSEENFRLHARCNKSSRMKQHEITVDELNRWDKKQVVHLETSYRTFGYDPVSRKFFWSTYSESQFCLHVLTRIKQFVKRY